ncbi:MAG TPA: NAD-dependent epimerase/dehydratase family protein, partial [Edaphobacter sp.]|nr:NAD-dependent epimerase/dehydratase family protein [Edaphobacter sp.]
MRVVVIGGTGHIGTYLTPRLAENGHSVLCVSRGLRSPYRDHAAWRTIENVLIDRASEEAAGSFGERIASLDPEVVIDLTCYKPESAELLTNSLLGRIQH